MDLSGIAAAVVSAMRHPVLVLDRELSVVLANHAFCNLFRVPCEETVGRAVYELGNGQWNIPRLRELLEQVLPNTETFDDFEVEHDFEQLGRRVMLLNARSIGDMKLILLAIEDVTERRRSEQALRASEERQRRMLETCGVGKPAEQALQESRKRYEVLFNSIDQGFCTIEMIYGPAGKPIDYRFLDVNASFERQTGLMDAVGKTMRTLKPDHEQHWFEIYGRIALTGTPERFELPAAAMNHYYEVYAFKIGDPDERKVGILFNDISERKRGEEERELLVHELSHRVKNILAVVQALAVQSSRQSESVEAFREAFLGRLHAMARAHSLLLDAQWKSADLRSLVEQAIEAYKLDNPEAIRIDGETAELTSRQGLGLSLMLHELGTNAAKYGALSKRDGWLSISWRIEDTAQGRLMRLQWRERHGPLVKPPEKQGFGTRMLERTCLHELGGEVEFDYAPEGLTCGIEFPLD